MKNDIFPFEVHGHRENGDIFGAVVLGYLTYLAALEIAQQYSDRWNAPVSLWRVPYVDENGASWKLDEFEIVAQLVPVVEATS